MDRIHYAGDSVITGTAIAHALLSYAEALAQVGTAATVSIPTLNPDGTQGTTQVLVGPASQLMSETEESEHPEVVDDELVAHLAHSAEHLRLFGPPAPTAAFDDPPTPEWSDPLG